MRSVPTSQTFVDARSTERPITHTLTVAIRPVTSTLRLGHDDIPASARWAAVAYDGTGRAVVWPTDTDPGIGNLVTTARTLALADGARFIAPDATCEWCGVPVDPECAFCPTSPGRDCEALFRSRETTWRQLDVQPRRSGAAWALSCRDLPAVA